MKKFKMKYLVKAQAAYIRYFGTMDEDYPDYRAVRGAERSMDYWIFKITENNAYDAGYTKVKSAIEKGSWDFEDRTFKPILNKLKEVGYEVEGE